MATDDESDGSQASEEAAPAPQESAAPAEEAAAPQESPPAETPPAESAAPAEEAAAPQESAAPAEEAAAPQESAAPAEEAAPAEAAPEETQAVADGDSQPEEDCDCDCDEDEDEGEGEGEGEGVDSSLLSAPGGEIDTQLGRSGTGYYAYGYASRRYGRARTVEAIEAIGRAWAEAYPSGPRLGIGNISKHGGGKLSPHKSHRNGLDVDIRAVRKDGKERGTTYKSSAYSRELTRKLVELARSNGVLRVKFILFNDSQIAGVNRCAGHDDHIHIRFSLK